MSSKQKLNAWKFSNCQTQKTVNTWKISGMLIVYWPITIKFRIRKQTSKPQTNYRCCLRFSYLAPYLLISPNTITFHKYFWCSRFCELHSNVRNTYRFSLAGITSFIWGSPQVSNYQREWKAQINKKHLDNKTSYRWGTRWSFTVWKAL